jgi:hypothetical protein
MKFASVFVASLLLCTASIASEVQTSHSKPNSTELLLPSNYRNWVTLSPATLGISAHHRKRVANKLYVEPAAYEHFAKTGEWPNKTVIVLEMVSGKKNRDSKPEVMGLEAAVKDEAQFPDSWSYYGIVFDRPQEKKQQPLKAEAMCDGEQPLDSMLAMAFPTLRSVINAKPWTMSPSMF